MYVFCATLPFGAIVALGGLMGYAKAGSVASLMAGGGSGVVALLLGWKHLSAYNSKKKGEISAAAYSSTTRMTTGASLVLTSVLGYSMGKRYQSGGKFMPAGLITYLAASTAVICAARLYAPGAPPAGPARD